MNKIDVLVITALQEEHDAFLQVTTDTFSASWTEKDKESTTPYMQSAFDVGSQKIKIALARPVRMGGQTTSRFTATLVERLKPFCLAMCGVCAGNPNTTSVGDVIIADIVYQYDEGKIKEEGFIGDHRQMTMSEQWIRAAQNFHPKELSSFGPASSEESKQWFLEQLLNKKDPKKQPARIKFFPKGTWGQMVKSYISDGLIIFKNNKIELTDKGAAFIQEALYFDDDGPKNLPFSIKVGPIASGNAVVKDGLTWSKLINMGVRSIVGIEMEAATIGGIAESASIPNWIVVKGVMDHADPLKDDRYKLFAARASAEVLMKLLLDNIHLINFSRNAINHVDKKMPHDNISNKSEKSLMVGSSHDKHQNALNSFFLPPQLFLMQ